MYSDSEYPHSHLSKSHRKEREQGKRKNPSKRSSWQNELTKYFNHISTCNICRWLLPFPGTSERIILLQNPWNIWPPAHFTHSPEEGSRPSAASEQASYCWCLGAAARSLSLMSWACLPGKQYSSGLRPENRGVTRSSRSELDSWWESVIGPRYGSLRPRWGVWTGGIKTPPRDDKTSPRQRLSRLEPSFTVNSV